MAKITRVGVDLAKNVFHIHAVDENEKTVWQGKASTVEAIGSKLLLNVRPKPQLLVWRLVALPITGQESLLNLAMM